ncbi:acylphosphatase [Salinisphaera sp. LB1]|uniref:acylphosphatase n=1 Tax=Salinisphaera sp. LB1 TaxID=2183911 RepID=UPI000D7089DC|nr:acylphosphatase [Salinisphaera sp. LB1]AWN15180.1 Acylphosphate phosphohydrolase, putative [Salinisphaera sp. LB1]
MSETRYFRVRGRVQGVGFRAATSDTARKLSLDGWVRNRGDGDVELMARGAPENLDALRDWLHEGPGMARVGDVSEQAADETDLPSPFTVA